MNHKIVSVFHDEPHEAEPLLDKYLENSPVCKDAKYDWYLVRAGDTYFKPLSGENPDSTGHYRKNQMSYDDMNAAGGAIKLRPSAYITPDGEYHSPDNYKNGQQGYNEEWDNWIQNPANPYIDSAECTLF